MAVEVHRHAVGDDFHELAFELLHRLVLRRDAAVDRVEHFAQMCLSHTIFAAVLHVVDGDGHVGSTLVQRFAFVQLEVVELDVHDRVGMNGLGQFAEIAPVAFVDPLSTSRGLTTSMSLTFLTSSSLTLGGDAARSTGMADIRATTAACTSRRRVGP